MADLNEFQSKIGYTFKNRHLLEQALTHSSYVGLLCHFVQSHLTWESTCVLAGARITQVAERENRFFLMHLRQ